MRIDVLRLINVDIFIKNILELRRNLFYSQQCVKYTVRYN